MRKSTQAVLTVACAIGLTTTVAPDLAQATGPDAHHAAAGPAGAAIEALTSAGPVAAATTIPDDFTVRAGYLPTVIDGVLVNPHGDCSSPVPLPAEFDIGCKEHDLGYDLLRYADSTGAPLGAWARRSLDRLLEERLHAACAGRPDAAARTSCSAMATVAVAAVNSNSWRQSYTAPTPEPIGDFVTAGGLGLLGVAAAAFLRRRRSVPGAPIGVVA